MVFFINIGFVNVIGRYYLILNDRRDVIGEFHHIDVAPMLGDISAWHSVALPTKKSVTHTI